LSQTKIQLSRFPFRLVSYLSYIHKNLQPAPIALLCNKLAGKGNADAVAAHVSRILHTKSIAHDIIRTNWPRDFAVYSSVWIIGGDGTLNYFINHASMPLPPLVLLKAGTGNDFSTDLYGPATNTEIVEIALTSSPQPVDMGLCNGIRFINMAGIGFDGQVMKNMETIRWMGRSWGYLYAIIRTIFLFQEPEYEISVNDEQLDPGRYLLVQVANSPTTGGGFNVSPKARINDGTLNMLFCQPLSIMKRLLKLPLIRKGRHLDEPYITHRHITSAIVRAKKPIPAQLDGELVFAGQFEFSVQAGALSFLYSPKQRG